MKLFIILCIILLIINRSSSDNNTDINYLGHKTPISVLPLRKDINIDISEIEKWYNIGITNCNNELKTLCSTNKCNNHATPYSSNNWDEKCGGKYMFNSVTGMLAYPFGPTSCSVGSSCWFGILSCGVFTKDNVNKISKEFMSKELKYILGKETSIPTLLDWSICSLSFKIRVLGNEIIVPGQSCVNISQDQVIIGQYQMTIPGNYTLEIRYFEWYQGTLLNWDKNDSAKYGLHNVGILFLGGSQGRCPPYTYCNMRYYSKQCDQDSMIVDYPLIITIDKCSNRCPDNAKKMPTCDMKKDNNPTGRWIAIDHCDEKVNNCINPNGAPEELSIVNWYYQPYTCNYHNYNPKEIGSCLKYNNIKRIHFIGDSMSRDLFAALCSYLGIPNMTEERLKEFTRKKRSFKFDYLTNGVHLTEGYTWDFSLDILRDIEDNTTLPLPDVLITNYGLSHRTDFLYQFVTFLNKTERDFWLNKRNKNIALPRFRFYQNARELQGKREGQFRDNIIRENNEIVNKMYKEFNFDTIDEYQITTGRYDTYSKHSDGWHFQMGTPRLMEIIILFNKICYSWYLKNFV